MAWVGTPKAKYRTWTQAAPVFLLNDSTTFFEHPRNLGSGGEDEADATVEENSLNGWLTSEQDLRGSTGKNVHQKDRCRRTGC